MAKVNNNRRYPGIRGWRPDKKDARVGIAQANAEIRAKRSAKEQLAELDKRLGKGKGAIRERARLQAK